jgi:hypothetical protein
MKLYLVFRRPDVDDMCVRDVGEYSGDNHFHLDVVHSYTDCGNKSLLTVFHEFDPALTVMLTLVSLNS